MRTLLCALLLFSAHSVANADITIIDTTTGSSFDVAWKSNGQIEQKIRLPDRQSRVLRCSGFKVLIKLYSINGKLLTSGEFRDGSVLKLERRNSEFILKY